MPKRKARSASPVAVDIDAECRGVVDVNVVDNDFDFMMDGDGEKAKAIALSTVINKIATMAMCNILCIIEETCLIDGCE